MDQYEPRIYKTKSQFREVGQRLKKNRAATFGLFVLSVFVLLAIFADVIIDYERVIYQDLPNRLQKPSREHWFGTDAYGRDVFARIVHGSRVSLLIGLISVGAATLVGCTLGAIAGYYGGKTDNIIMRIMDTLLCIPPVLLALAMVASLGPGVRNLLIAITVCSVPGFTRVIRAAVLQVVGQEFIEAARASGATTARIIVRHVLPNCMGPIIVQGTMAVGTQIINAASLSFLGMGVQPPSPEWGAMLAEAKEYMRHSAHLVFFPGFSILLVALSLNLLGDGLRDVLDPRLK